ncbi:MAG: 50S ribosomal protein L25 [uncultured bacterium (gcode 4)]|uniref:Large ribosomal subunit protein bL25 n=1 Tax=uncultured bacterium (gcode 4) TaxID=1234023 RepID=K1YDL1_9BACT|nr:MAG: 50S ribosomal protein L25 [uncultured bacterium (gcode 4)]HBB26919.1 50S ribosomal protein L25 [Candidatus Gracilibacteria bacterium]
MEKLTLAAVSRDTETKLSTIRGDKKVPAVVYGHNVASQSITVGASELLKIFRKSGKTHIVELTLDGKKQDVLIHETQRAPVSGDFLHVDFFAVSATEKIHVQIPLHLIGTSPAQVLGGLIEQNMHTVEVKCLPKNLVDVFEVDLSKLENLGDIIHVQDLNIDTKKFDILSDLEGAIVSVRLPKGTQDEEVVAEVAAAEVPSVQDEKKAEKEAKAE